MLLSVFSPPPLSDCTSDICSTSLSNCWQEHQHSSASRNVTVLGTEYAWGHLHKLLLSTWSFERLLQLSISRKQTVGRELQCLHSQANDTCWKVLWKLILIMGEAVDYSGINLLTSAVVTQLRELNWKVGLSLHVWWKVVGSNSGEYMVAGQNQSGCSP